MTTEYSWQDLPPRRGKWRLMMPWTTDLDAVHINRAGHAFTKLNPTRIVAREVSEITVLEEN